MKHGESIAVVHPELEHDEAVCRVDELLFDVHRCENCGGTGWFWLVGRVEEDDLEDFVRCHCGAPDPLVSGGGNG